MDLNQTLAARSTNLLSWGLDSLQAGLDQPQAGAILRALAILALGAAGIYLMLPRGSANGKRWPRYLGGALATLAIVLLIALPVPTSVTVSPLEDDTGNTFLWPIDDLPEVDQPDVTCYTFHFLAFCRHCNSLCVIYI